MGVPIVAKEAEDVEHRGAAEEVHGGAAEGAGAGTGAAGPIITFPNALTVSSAGAGYTNPSMITYGMGWVLASPGVYFGTVTAQQAAPLVDEGVKVGEVIAWRAWRVVGVRLQSLSMSSFWQPGEPMEGRPFANIYEGVYAYKTRKRLLDEHCYVDSSAFSAGTFAYGEVALCGNIVEHDHGYRAQYARILNLNGHGLPAELYTTYGFDVPKRSLPSVWRRLRGSRWIIGLNGLVATFNLSLGFSIGSPVSLTVGIAGAAFTAWFVRLALRGPRR